MFEALIFSRRICVAIFAIIGFFSFFALLRLLFFSGFLNLPESVPTSTLVSTAYIGLKFDLRWEILF